MLGFKGAERLASCSFGSWCNRLSPVFWVGCTRDIEDDDDDDDMNVSPPNSPLELLPCWLFVK